MNRVLLAALLLTACRESARPDAVKTTATVDETEGDDALPQATAVAADGRPARARLLDEARREVDNAKTSSYSHTTKIDEASGTYLVDCSGFIDYALSRVDAPALAALPRAPGHPRPRAEDFAHAFLANGATWKRVSAVKDLGPGDVVAWTRPADSSSKNTGHVMLVEGAPRAHSATEWVVPILDSTASAHGSNDTRAAAKASGLGKGAIVLVVDAAGAPTEFRWSEQHASGAHATTIALGRLE